MFKWIFYLFGNFYCVKLSSTRLLFYLKESLYDSTASAIKLALLAIALLIEIRSFEALCISFVDYAGLNLS